MAKRKILHSLERGKKYPAPKNSPPPKKKNLMVRPLYGPIYMPHLSRISFVAKQLSLGFLRLKCGVEIHAAFQVFCAACELHVREI